MLTFRSHFVSKYLSFLHALRRQLNVKLTECTFRPFTVPTVCIGFNVIDGTVGTRFKRIGATSCHPTFNFRLSINETKYHTVFGTPSNSNAAAAAFNKQGPCDQTPPYTYVSDRFLRTKRWFLALCCNSYSTCWFNFEVWSVHVNNS